MLKRRQALVGYLAYRAMKPLAKRALRKKRGPLLGAVVATAGVGVLAAWACSSCEVEESPTSLEATRPGTNHWTEQRIHRGS